MRTSNLMFVFLVALLAITSGLATAVPIYDLEVVSNPNCYAFAQSINDSGAIAAYGYPNGSSVHGLIYGRDGVRDLGPNTWAADVNTGGVPCGQNYMIAAYWKNRRSVLIDKKGDYSVAYSINTIGDIACSVAYRPYLFDGKLHRLSENYGAAMVVNDDGLVGGNIYSPTNGHSVPVLWEKQKKGYVQLNLPLPVGAVEGYVYALDEQGNAVGYTVNASYAVRATVWTKGGSRRNPVYSAMYLPAFEANSFAMGVNAKGQVVGAGEQSACIWQGGQVYDLNYRVVDLKGCRLFAAMSINDSGQIACRAYYYATGYTVVVRLTPRQ